MRIVINWDDFWAVEKSTPSPGTSSAWSYATRRQLHPFNRSVLQNYKIRRFLYPREDSTVLSVADKTLTLDYSVFWLLNKIDADALLWNQKSDLSVTYSLSALAEVAIHRFYSNYIDVGQNQTTSDLRVQCAAYLDLGQFLTGFFLFNITSRPHPCNELLLGYLM